MDRQQKRLASYLEKQGLSLVSNEAVGITVSESWGGLRRRDLMDEVLEKENFDRAVQQVVQNKGAEGMDGMSVAELPSFVNQHWDEIYTKLRLGLYKPRPVRRVTIPKPDGGERNLGIPTVLDRAIQQAVSQVLSKIYEPKFSERSFGFRPGRSAHDAVLRLKDDIEQGYTWAVDIDISKYFDNINHDILMEMLRRSISDETLLVLIKRFLKSGILADGILINTERGSPQGGNLSPLLANIYLDDFDKLLEERGLRFARYADDIVILVKTQKASARVMKSCANFLEGELKLKVNQEKSRSCLVSEIKFLGFSFAPRSDSEESWWIVLHPKTIERFKNKIRSILKKNSSATIEDSLVNLTKSVIGWINYYGLASCKRRITELECWARRKLRAKMLKQWKRSYRRYRNLTQIATDNETRFSYRELWNTLKFDGLWAMADNPAVEQILNNSYLESIGFPSMLNVYEEAHSRILNRRIR